MIALIIFMVLDYITGLMCAITDKKLSSAVGFKGICKKLLILMLVGVANVVDIHIVGTGSALRSAVICFYLSNEGLSLLENAAHIGLPIPDKMKDVLAQLHGREEKDNTDAGDGELPPPFEFRRILWQKEKIRRSPASISPHGARRWWASPTGMAAVFTSVPRACLTARRSSTLRIIRPGA